jgi:hypothetical protein
VVTPDWFGETATGSIRLGVELSFSDWEHASLPTEGVKIFILFYLFIPHVFY